MQLCINPLCVPTVLTAQDSYQHDRTSEVERKSTLGGGDHCHSKEIFQDLDFVSAAIVSPGCFLCLIDSSGLNLLCMWFTFCIKCKA